MSNSRKIIITGGPGAGKSSLLQALQNMGYNCSAEVSRQLIAEHVKAGSTCLPWTDMACFADKVLQRMIQEYSQSAIHPGITFFDRGIPDIVAYLEVAGLSLTEPFQAALQAYPYAAPVFILPPWEAIYVNDEERWQTFDEATVLY